MSLFEICPTITETDEGAVAKSSLLVRILTLGAFQRRITVCRSQNSVSINRRLLWCLSSTRQLCFSEVAAVTYGYSNMNVSALSEASDRRWDWFSVGLLLHDQENVHAFFFIGDGGKERTGFIEYCPVWWQRLFSTVDRQEPRSLEFAKMLASQIGVSIQRDPNSRAG